MARKKLTPQEAIAQLEAALKRQKEINSDLHQRLFKAERTAEAWQQVALSAGHTLAERYINEIPF